MSNEATENEATGFQPTDKAIMFLLDRTVSKLSHFIESHGLLGELDEELLQVIAIARMDDE